MQTTSLFHSAAFPLTQSGRVLLAAAALAMTALVRPAAAAADKSPADRAFDTIVPVAMARPLDGIKAVQLAFDAFRDYPTDARFIRMLPAVPSWGHQVPESERAAFKTELNRRIAVGLSAPGLSDESWEVYALTDLALVISEQGASAAPDTELVRAKIDALAARRPLARDLPRHEMMYVRLLEKTDLAAGKAHLHRLTAGPNEALAEQAAGELRARELRHTPLEMKFTAADGREVDIVKMRGKVVLIDFWATWCSPCVAELPHLRRAYEAYHDMGLEIVGIAFENAKLTAADTEEQKASKLAAARTNLLKFSEEKGLPWPHHFDGRFMENEFGSRYNVRGLPTLFLIGRDGRLVAMNVRGKQLDAELERLFAM